MSTLKETSLGDYGHPVFKRDGFRCVYCGFDGNGFDRWRQLSLSRLTPVGAGGTDSDDNLVTACHFCNSVTARMKFSQDQSASEILASKKARVKERLEASRGFWWEKVHREGPVSTSRKGGPYLSTPLLLDLSSLQLTDRQLEKISADNEPLQLELTAKGELVIMPPAGSRVGWAEGELYFQITQWAKQDRTGVTFNASAGFRLPNGAVYAPDVSWTTRERWEQWLAEQDARSKSDDPRERQREESFARFCPDFVLELRSPSDTLASIQRKMAEYIENGCRLGLLVNPQRKQVHIYRPETAPEVLDDPESVSGDPVLPGLELNVREIW